jgi:glycosyltransferase involved in cell wall biosynthesis
VRHFHVGPVGVPRLEGDRAGAPEPVDRDSLLSSFALPPDTVLATTVARLSEQKGHAVLVEGARLLRERHPTLRYLWVGDGEARPALEGVIAQAGVGDLIRLAGFRTDVRPLLRASDLFVLPTLYEGGCSQALLEAMEEGCACVVSALPGVKDVARNGCEAVLVEPGSATALAAAVERLARSPRLRRRLGKAARARSRLYSSLTAFRRTTELLDMLAGTNAAGHPVFHDSRSAFGYSLPPLISKVSSFFSRMR